MPANGSAGEAMRMLCARLPGTHILLNEEIDGNVPLAPPRSHRGGQSPAADRYRDRPGVRARHRVSTATATGSASSTAPAVSCGGDQILMLLARDVLARHPGATVIADVKSEPVPVRRDRPARRGSDDVEHRTFADQGEDGGDRCAARRRDERAHLHRRPLFRLRRRDLCRGPASRLSVALRANPCGDSRPSAGGKSPRPSFGSGATVRASSRRSRKSAAGCARRAPR